MIHIVETYKSVETAVADLTEAVKRHGFGVLHTYDLRAKMQEKGVEFPRECRILEVCNPHRAAEVLGADMEVSLALPCRITVYEEGGKTKIGTLLPTKLLEVFPNAEAVAGVAREVEGEILAMIEEAAA
ncbi:MAG: DUF302 domain-containing protein [Candidatus Dadabacteria bacterium]|nr:MAG: DUF302 domain-containing protein [Candidatus Dadabacteria bacterium]